MAASKSDDEKELLTFERTFMWNLLQIFKQTLADVDDESNGLLRNLLIFKGLFRKRFVGNSLYLKHTTLFSFPSFLCLL